MNLLPLYMNKLSLYIDITGGANISQLINHLVCESLWVWTPVPAHPHHWEQDRNMKFLYITIQAQIVHYFLLVIPYLTQGCWRINLKTKTKKPPPTKKDTSIYYVCTRMFTHTTVHQWSQRTTCSSSFHPLGPGECELSHQTWQQLWATSPAP